MSNLKVQNPVEEDVYIEVKAAQDNDVNSRDVAADLGLTVFNVNAIYAAESYDDYAGGRKPSKTILIATTEPDEEQPEDTEDDAEDEADEEEPDPDPEQKRRSEKVAPARAGYLTKIVERKKEENIELSERQEILAQSIKSMWGLLRLLEWRKRELEREVFDLEAYVRKLSQFIDPNQQ